MPREKATITLDRKKVNGARELLSATSTSEVIDLALDHLIRTERHRRDVAARGKQPLGSAETSIGDLPVELDLEDGDVHHDERYGRRR